MKVRAEYQDERALWRTGGHIARELPGNTVKIEPKPRIQRQVRQRHH